MDKKYPSLRRPQKKLNFLPSKESSAHQWAAKTTAQDIERLFDDLDSASDCENDILPLCETFSASLPPLKTPLTKIHTQFQTPPEADVLDEAVKINCPRQDIESYSPFRKHEPIKTSSPIELNVEMEESHFEKERAVSPLLIVCEDDVQEDLKKVSAPIQKPQCNVQITQKGDDSSLSPPKTFALSNFKAASPMRKRETCNKTGPVAEKAAKKCLTPALDAKGPLLLRQELQHSAQEKETLSESNPSTHVGQEFTAFLQKLRHPGQTKAECSREPVSPVKIPVPLPEPEEDFMILEEEVPLWFSLPRRGDPSNSRSRQKQSKQSTDIKGTTESQPEEAETQPQSEPSWGTTTVEDHFNHQKTKKKGKADPSAKKTALKKAKLIRPSDETNEDFSPCQEELPANAVTEQDKRQIEKEWCKASKASHAAGNEVQPEESLVAGSVEKRSVSLEKEAKKTKKLSRAKTAKYGKNAKDRVMAVKLNRKGSQEKNQELGSEYPGGGTSPGEPAGQSFGPVTKTVKPEGHGKGTSKDAAVKKPEQDRPPSSGEADTSDAKRKRKTPGEWWLIALPSPEQTKHLEDLPMLKKSKQNQKGPNATAPPPVKVMQSGNAKERKRMPSALPVRQSTGQKMDKRKGKQAKRKKATEKPAAREEENLAEDIGDQEKRGEGLETNVDPVELSPPHLPVKELRPTTGVNIFDRTYQRTPNKKLPSATVPIVTTVVAAHAENTGPEKRRRRLPNNWWEVNNLADDTESPSYQPERTKAANLKKRKGDKPRTVNPKPLTHETPQNHNTAVSPKSPAPLTPKQSPPKIAKRSLAMFKDVKETPRVAKTKTTIQKRRRAVRALSEEASECPTEDPVNDPASDLRLNEADNARVVMGAPRRSRLSWPSSLEIQEKRLSGSMLQGFKSGPPSMIEPNQFVENEGSFLEFPRATPNVLCPTELCGPPLVPLVLQEEDKANITEWLSVIWPTTGYNASQTTPDHFQWFSHRGRALGFQVDLYTDSFCNGKILLGSCMKKPLWVDHSAVTVFNILTSCMSATVNGTETRYNPGQSFMVPCGQAYSLKNLTAEPVVLYFNRMLAESTD